MVEAMPDASSASPIRAEDILNSIAEAFIVLSSDWKVKFVNREAEAVLARDAAEVIGRDWWELFPSLSGTDTERVFRRALAEQRPGQIEHWSQRRNKWYYGRAYPSALGLTIAFTDITELRADRQAQQINHERFRLAARNRMITLYEQDRELRYTWLYPLHPEHVHAFGRRDEELTPNETGRRLAALKRQVMETGTEIRTETSAQLASGTHHYDLFIAPRRNDLGEIVGVSGAAFDITERKVAEEALHRHQGAQTLLYRLVETVNRAATLEEIYGAAFDAFSGSVRCYSIDVWLYAEIAPPAVVASRTVSSDPAAADAAIVRVPLPFERREIGHFEVKLATGAALSSDETQLADAIARQVAIGIERHRSAAALESLVQMRTASLQEAIHQMEEFSYSVSHDLRAPLRAMLSYAELILTDHGGELGTETREFVERIRRNAQRMDSLVRDSLDYSRVARRDLVLAPVSLDRLAQDAIATLQASGAAARFTVHGPLGAVFAHESSLGQALSNLLHNAVKFVRTDVVPQVTLSAATRDGRVRLMVTDNGIGIAPHLQAKLFRMFERLNTERHYEGTGIGLAIVRKAVERMGGTAGVISDGQNGSTFWIDLPAA